MINLGKQLTKGEQRLIMSSTNTLAVLTVANNTELLGNNRMADEMFAKCSDDVIPQNKEVQNVVHGLERKKMLASCPFEGHQFHLVHIRSDSLLSPLLQQCEGAWLQLSTVEAPLFQNAAEKNIYVSKTGLGFLLEDFMLDTIIHTEAMYDYRTAIEKLIQYVATVKNSVGDTSKQSEYYFQVYYYKYYTGLLQKELRQVNELHLELSVLFAMFEALGIPANLFWDLPPSDVYTLFLAWFKMDASEESVFASIPIDTNVFQRQIFSEDKKKSLFATTILVYPIIGTDFTEFIEGYGEGCGETDEESKVISFNVACRVVIKEICSGFVCFLNKNRVRKFGNAETKKYDNNACNYVLFSKVRSCFQKFDQKTSTIDIQKMMRDSLEQGCEYLKNSKFYIPLSKAHSGLIKQLCIPTRKPTFLEGIRQGKEMMESYVNRESLLMSRNAEITSASSETTTEVTFGVKQTRRLPYVYALLGFK